MYVYIYIYDRAYASSSSCDGKRACACAPKASAADARVQKIARPRAGPEAVCLLPAAAATSDLCMCPERHQWQSQRVQGCARMQPTDLWATSECRTHRPASKAPLPVHPSRAPERQSATGGAHGAAAGGQAAPPAAPRPAAPSPSVATATPGRVGRATRACGCSCASSSAAIRPGNSVGALCELRAPCAPPKPSSLSGPLPKPPGSVWGTSARCSPPRPRARS